MSRAIRIAPSILQADLSKLADECSRLVDAGADFLHLDVMDGQFVPNITFGHPVVKCLREHVKSSFFDVHMMVDKPERWVPSMADAGANQYTFHLEATDDVEACIRKVKEHGMKVGLGIKPGTKVEALERYIPLIDVALVMTVEPGFGGQKFMHDMMPKVSYLHDKAPTLDIEVDGGVGPTNVISCVSAGANLIVSGSAITNSDAPADVIKHLKLSSQAVAAKLEPTSACAK